MDKYRSEYEKNRADQQQAEQQAARQFREANKRTDEQVQQNLEENGCGGLAGCLHTTLDVIWYAVTCCSGCTSWEEYTDDTYD